MKNGNVHFRLGSWRLRFDYIGPMMDAADPWRWQLVIGPFEWEYRSSLDRLVGHDLDNCRDLLSDQGRQARIMSLP